MFFLKQSTAVVVPLGPAVSATDGITFTTGLAGTGSGKLENTSNGVHLIKNGGSAAVRHATATASTEDALSKSYLVTLDTTDTATLGTLRVGFNVAGTLDMAVDCMVLSAASWDGIYGSTGLASAADLALVKKNTALTKFAFMMTDSTNHAPATGKTVTCTRSIDGGAFAAGTLANVAEVANGMYIVDFGAGDLNGKVIVLRCTATGCDDTFVTVVTQG